MTWEYNFLSWVQEHRVAIVNPIMKFLSFLGDKGWFWILVALILLMMRQTRRTGMDMAVAMLLLFIVGNLILKNVIDRTRPYNLYQSLIPLAPKPHDASFPSGHTMHSFGAATAIFLNDRRWGTAALVLAFGIGISRMYNGMHYPTDVLAGALLGVAAGCLAHWIVGRYMDSRKKHIV